MLLNSFNVRDCCQVLKRSIFQLLVWIVILVMNIWVLFLSTGCTIFYVCILQKLNSLIRSVTLHGVLLKPLKPTTTDPNRISIDRTYDIWLNEVQTVLAQAEAQSVSFSHTKPFHGPHMDFPLPKQGETIYNMNNLK